MFRIYFIKNIEIKRKTFFFCWKAPSHTGHKASHQIKVRGNQEIKNVEVAEVRRFGHVNIVDCLMKLNFHLQSILINFLKKL